MVRLHPTIVPGVIVLQGEAFEDERGRFMEVYRESELLSAGIPTRFVQDNVSISRRGVLRGLHFQSPGGQGKLVSVLQGAVFDVAVDVRPDSPTFRRWVGETLTADNLRQLYVPEGFAHGFLVLSDQAVVHYKCTDYYCPASERALRWDDPRVAIAWPSHPEVISAKDLAAPSLDEVPPELLPRCHGSR